MSNLEKWDHLENLSAAAQVSAPVADHVNLVRDLANPLNAIALTRLADERLRAAMFRLGGSRQPVPLGGTSGSVSVRAAAAD